MTPNNNNNKEIVVEEDLSSSLPDNSSPSISEKKSSAKQLLQWVRSTANSKLTSISSNTIDNKQRVEDEGKKGIDNSLLDPSKLPLLKGKESPAAVTTCHKQKLNRSNQATPLLNESLTAPGIECKDCGLKMTVGLIRPFTCPKCLNSFCVKHSPPVINGVTFEMKLNPHTRQIDYSIKGMWMRTCRDCFVIGQGHGHGHGQASSKKINVVRSLMDYYGKVRSECREFREIESMRIKKRLEKFSDFQGKSYPEYERTVVPWQSDQNALECTLCCKEFTLTIRRHHCRLCGKIICGSGNCSRFIPLRMEGGKGIEQLRSCDRCYGLLFGRRAKRILDDRETKMNALFKTCSVLKVQILEMIPRFNEYLLTISDLYHNLQVSPQSTTETIKIRLDQSKHDAWALRDTLILISLHLRNVYQDLAELIELDVDEFPVQKVFAGNLRRAGNGFIQVNMFTLQVLPSEKSFKGDFKVGELIQNREYEDEDTVQGGNKVDMSKFTRSLGKLKTFLSATLDYHLDQPTQSSSPPATNQSALQSKLSVLKEQQILLQEQLNSAKLALRFEESAVLSEAVRDIEWEIEGVQRSLKN